MIHPSAYPAIFLVILNKIAHSIAEADSLLRDGQVREFKNKGSLASFGTSNTTPFFISSKSLDIIVVLFEISVKRVLRVGQ